MLIHIYTFTHCICYLHIPRVHFRDGDTLVLSVLRLHQEPVEEVDQGDGVLLGGEYRDHQVRGEAALAQRLVKDRLTDKYLVHHSMDVRLAYMKFCESCVKDENLLLVELDT